MNRTNVWDAFRIGSNPSPFSVGTSSTQLQVAVNLDWSTEAQSGNPFEELGFEIELNLAQILDDEESNIGANVTASTPLATRGINTTQAPSRSPRTNRIIHLSDKSVVRSNSRRPWPNSSVLPMLWELLCASSDRHDKPVFALHPVSIGDST